MLQRSRGGTHRISEGGRTPNGEIDRWRGPGAINSRQIRTNIDRHLARRCQRIIQPAMAISRDRELGRRDPSWGGQGAGDRTVQQHITAADRQLTHGGHRTTELVEREQAGGALQGDRHSAGRRDHLAI